VRYNDGHEIINIETTARGINIDSEDYLNIDTCQLQKRNIKEVIGFAHVNHASIYLQEAIYDKSLESYKKAQPYLKEDCLLKELMGFNYLFVGQENEAQQMLVQIKDHIPDFSLTKSSTVEDYLNGKADAECIKTIFLRVDENRESVIKKKEALEEILKRHPQFRAGLSSLATTWLQLHRVSEALVYLEKLYNIDPSDPTTNYYLSALYAERMDYNKAWKHLLETEKIVQAKNHFPNALKELRRELENLSPE
jgi:tetratricopeptide (TPR) repeat protein